MTDLIKAHAETYSAWGRLEKRIKDNPDQYNITRALATCKAARADLREIIKDLENERD